MEETRREGQEGTYEREVRLGRDGGRTERKGI